MKDTDLVLRKLPKNIHGNDYVVGDIHGCYFLLMASLEDMGFCFEKDRLIAVGDLCDKGKDSYKCLNLLYEPWFYSVLGNHEDMMYNAMLDQSVADYRCWIQNGGAWFLEHTKTKSEEEEFLILLEDIYHRMPLAYEVETANGLVGVVHAEPPPIWSKEAIRDTRMKCLWGRDNINKRKEVFVEGVSQVYVGHSYVEEPVTLENITYLDTGAVFTGNLTIHKIN